MSGDSCPLPQALAATASATTADTTEFVKRVTLILLLPKQRNAPEICSACDSLAIVIDMGFVVVAVI